MSEWGRQEVLTSQAPPALLRGHSPDGSTGEGLCVTFLLGEKILPSSQGSLFPRVPLPSSAWPLHPPGGAGLTVPPRQRWGLETSAFPGAWDPAELEQVGPIGQDLETARGAAPGTQTPGTCPAGSPSPAVPLPPLLLAGGCPMPWREEAGGGRIKSSRQPAQCPAPHQHPSPHGPLWSPKRAGQIPSDCPGQRTLSGNHVSPRTRCSPL